MSDDLEPRSHHAITHDGETYIKLADASVTFSLYRKDIAAKDAEITRLRAGLATARREGMEEAAKIAADFETVAYQHGNLPADDPHECAAQAAREIAASIRAAAQVVTP